MAKYEFEWTDEQATAVQEQLLNESEMGINWHRFLRKLADDISKQKPIPLPTKLGAVIRVLPSSGPVQHGAAGRVATRMQPGRTDGGPAWVVSDGPMDAYWLADHELAGLRFEVLFEGVDL